MFQQPPTQQRVPPQHCLGQPPRLTCKRQNHPSARRLSQHRSSCSSTRSRISDGRLYRKRDGQHLLRLLHALICQQLQITLNQQSSLARTSRRLHDPRLPNIECTLPLLPIGRQPVTDLFTAVVPFATSKRSATVHLAVHPGAVFLILFERRHIQTAQNSLLQYSHVARIALRLHPRIACVQTPLPAPTSTSSPPLHLRREASPPPSSLCGLPRQHAFSRLHIPSTLVPRPRAPAQTQPPSAARPPTRSHTAEAAAHPASPSTSRSATHARLVVDQKLAALDLIDAIHPHAQPQRAHLHILETPSRSASPQTALCAPSPAPATSSAAGAACSRCTCT